MSPVAVGASFAVLMQPLGCWGVSGGGVGTAGGGVPVIPVPNGGVTVIVTVTRGAMPPSLVWAVYWKLSVPTKPVSGVYWTVPVVGSSAVSVPSAGWLEISN